METISSAQNALFKHLLKLATTRRERLKQRQTLLDGVHLLAAWLDAGLAIERILVTPAGLQNSEVAALLVRAGVNAVQLAAPLFGQLSDLPSSSGILALVPMPQAPMPVADGFVLMLDGVQDPGNVGAILRTALAAGVQQVWLSDACADVWSPKVLRAGMGAQAVLPLIERADLPALARQFQGRIAALMLDGASDLYQTDLQGSLALVMGSEGQGVSAEMAALANTRVLIPMAAGIESLNVGHATAICLYEKMRQERLR